MTEQKTDYRNEEKPFVQIQDYLQQKLVIENVSMRLLPGIYVPFATQIEQVVPSASEIASFKLV